jgi:hypothetical protein
MNDPQLDLLQRTWCENAMPVMIQVAKTFDCFTADDLRDFQSVPQPPHSNWWGVLIARMKAKGMIRRIGYRPSLRPEANGRVVALWTAN